MRYKNPNYKHGYGPEYYEADKKPMLTYRGFSVFKRFERAYDYVYKGVCITERAGASKAKEVIDGILAGTDLLTDLNEKLSSAA